jgi:tetratricopeptide (TPR) repeat protein
MGPGDFDSLMQSREGIDTVLAEEQDSERVFSVGLACYRKKKMQEARRLFSRACEMNPQEPRYASYCGLLLAMVMRKLKEAEELCEGAVKRDPKSVDLLYNLGRVYLMQGRRQDALTVFRKGLQIEPNNVAIHRELENVGTRKKPVFSFLGRNNPLNRFAGMLRSKMFQHTSNEKYNPAKIVR